MVRKPITVKRHSILFRRHISSRMPVTGLRRAINTSSYEYLNTSKLLDKYNPLISSIYRLFSSYNGIFDQYCDCQDLRAQIEYEFVRLCNEYDPTRGVDFPGYIKMHLQNRVYHFVTKEQRKNSKEQPARIMAMGEDDESMIDNENTIRMIDPHSDYEYEKAEARASLNWDAIIGVKHRKLVEDVLFRGKTLEELAEEEGVAIKVLRLRLHFACKRLIEYNDEMSDYIKFHLESGKAQPVAYFKY